MNKRQRSEERDVRIALISAITLATLALGLLALVIAATSCSTAREFQPYRICREQVSRSRHDVGTVMWEALGDDNLRHFGFWPDRLRDDARQVLDVVDGGGYRMNRMCRLVAGHPFDASNAAPIGARSFQR